MNKPTIRIVFEDGKAYETVGRVTPLALPASPKMPCLECDGKGEAEYMGLTEDRYHWRDCHECDGTGLVDPYCETCFEPLAAGICLSCDLPSGWALAERSAYGMGGMK